MKKFLAICILSLVIGTPLVYALNYSWLSGVLFTTVSEASNRVSYTCNGSTTEFDFTFPILETDDLVVILRTTATGAESILTETTEYTVSATNNDYSSGGTVTTVSTYSSSYTLLLIRDTDMDQNTDLEDSGVLRLESLEDQLDKLTLIVQDLQEELNRCLKYPKTDATTISAELPNSVDRASTTLIFDSSSEPDVE